MQSSGSKTATTELKDELNLKMSNFKDFSTDIYNNQCPMKP